MGRGDRVAVVIGDFLDAIAMMFGVARLGAVYVLMNGDTTRYAAQHVLTDCAPVCVVAGGPADDVTPCAAELGVPVLRPRGSGRTPAPAPAPAPGPISSDLVSILYTSGSTGRPKGVVATHANMVFAAEAIARRLDLRENDVIGCVLPLAFDYGVYQILLSLISGATLVWGQGTDAGPGLLRFLRRHQVSVLPSVPGLAPEPRPALPPQRRTPAPAARAHQHGRGHVRDLLGRVRAHYPSLRIFLMFGLTECKRISILTPEELSDRPDSVGRPLDDTEILIIDPRTRRVLPPGEIGELIVRGPHVTRGYWNDPERTALRFRPWGPMSEHVLFTGDQCWTDADGYLYFSGRDDDVYKQNGFRVSATEVALAAEDVDGVDEAHCLPARGEDPAVLVVVGRCEPAELRAALHDRLEWFKVPDDIRVADRLPLNRNGKIDSTAIRRLVTAEAGDRGGGNAPGGGLRRSRPRHARHARRTVRDPAVRLRRRGAAGRPP